MGGLTYNPRSPAFTFSVRLGVFWKSLSNRMVVLWTQALAKQESIKKGPLLSAKHRSLSFVKLEEDRQVVDLTSQTKLAKVSPFQPH